MPDVAKAKVFKNGRSQAVRIPLEFRFASDSVYIRRDPQTGNLILSEVPTPPTWDEVFAALDAADIPDDFLMDRDRSLPQERPELFDEPDVE
jgi:antitoxin VapB